MLDGFRLADGASDRSRLTKKRRSSAAPDDPNERRFRPQEQPDVASFEGRSEGSQTLVRSVLAGRQGRRLVTIALAARLIVTAVPAGDA